MRLPPRRLHALPWLVTTLLAAAAAHAADPSPATTDAPAPGATGPAAATTGTTWETASSPPAPSPQAGPAASPTPAAAAKPLPPCACSDGKAPPRLDHIVEISFGTAQLFNDASRVVVPGERRLPTSAALLLAEWLGGETWAIAAFLNLPLGEAKLILADGTITYQAADPVGALGFRWSPLKLDVWEKRARVEAQVAAFVGRTIASINASGDTFVPVVSGRLHLHDPNGLALYIGVSWAFVRESLVLTYGLGYRF